ncbi:hypothetical protein EIK77_007445 [Talaromyces pinophilus]|nr:hypothetical protein EIK77_007445 [Talaromyces pinophilus]
MDDRDSSSHNAAKDSLLRDYRDENGVFDPILYRRKKTKISINGTTICMVINGILLTSIVVLLGAASYTCRHQSLRPPSLSDYRPVSGIEGIKSLSELKAESHWEDCGGSPEEAQAKSCKYDVVLVAWVPAECFDGELMESYLSEVDYPFWLDRALQQPTTLEEVRKGIHPVVFSNQEFHMAHCAYFLEMSIRGFRNSNVWDNTTLDMGHTKHCARTVRDHWLPEMGYSPLHMVWHSCGRP